MLKTFLYLAVICLALFMRESVQQTFTFIEGYEIDSSGDFGRECEIISGSVTVINCPREDKYTVYLTEMMANTTFPNIVNEIKGAQDSVVTDDATKDYIRKIEVTNVKVSFVKLSNERSDPLYKTSVIVVAKNEDSSAGSE